MRSRLAIAKGARKQAARELAARYKELKLDQRLDRLEKDIAKNEEQVRTLTVQAKADVERYELAHCWTVPKSFKHATTVC